MASPKSKPLSHKHKSSFYAIKMLVVRCLSQQTTAINANQQHCFTISTGPMRTRRRAHTFCVGHLFRRRNGAGARLYCRWRRRCVSMRVGHHRATTTERHRHTILVLLAHTHTHKKKQSAYKRGPQDVCPPSAGQHASYPPTLTRQRTLAYSTHNSHSNSHQTNTIACVRKHATVRPDLAASSASVHFIGGRVERLDAALAGRFGNFACARWVIAKPF